MPQMSGQRRLKRKLELKRNSMPFIKKTYDKVQRLNEVDYNRIIKDLREGLLESNRALDNARNMNDQLIKKTKRYGM